MPHMIVDNMDNNSKLYRYVDLPQLLTLLLNQTLYFPSIATLPDRNEFIDHGLGSLVKLFSNKDWRDKHTDTIPEMDDKLKRKINRIRSKIFVSCWSTNADDYALWRIYTNNSKFGFMIESTVGNIIESLSLNDDSIFFHKPMKYSYNSISNFKIFEKLLEHRRINDIIDFYAFMKMRNYEYEQEYRFVIYKKDNNANGLPIKCDLSKLILWIHYSPFMPEWFKSDLSSLTEKLRKFDVPTTVNAFHPLMHLIKLIDTTHIREN